MNKDILNRSGWLVAALLAGIMLGGGFTQGSDKVGVVDLTEVVEKSKFGKQNQDKFNQMRVAREGLLEFVDTYRVVSAAQATQLRALSLKDVTTADEKAQLERIKQDVMAADRKSTELSTKTQLTPEERTLMQEYANLSQAMADTARRWYQEFTNELQAWADKQKVDSIRRAREAINEVAKAQGYSVVFEAGIAPYGANNLTDGALKTMDAKS